MKNRVSCWTVYVWVWFSSVTARGSLRSNPAVTPQLPKFRAFNPECSRAPLAHTHTGARSQAAGAGHAGCSLSGVKECDWREDGVVTVHSSLSERPHASETLQHSTRVRALSDMTLAAQLQYTCNVATAVLGAGGDAYTSFRPQTGAGVV